jgi:hypothetical protein
MLSRITVVALLFAWLAGCASSDPAPAADQIASASTGSAAAARTDSAEEPQEICRVVEVTGSRFTRRVCASPEEWKALDKNTEQQMDMMRRSINNQSACSGSSCR